MIEASMPRRAKAVTESFTWQVKFPHRTNAFYDAWSANMKLSSRRNAKAEYASPMRETVSVLFVLSPFSADGTGKEKPLMQKSRPSNASSRQLSMPEILDVQSIEKLRPFLEKPIARRLGELGQLGDEPPLLLLSAGLFIGGTVARNRRLQRAAMRMALAHLIASGLKEWGKDHVDRSRPDEQLNTGRYYMAKGRSRDAALRSFPSGHTAGSIAIARAFSRDFPRYTAPALAVAAVIGALQVPRRAHFPGDVLAGAIVGALAEKIASLIIRTPETLPALA